MLHDFQKWQESFSAYIRHGATTECPQGVDPELMQVYVDGFQFGINEILSNCFPVLAAILSSEQWNKLIGDFYRQHAATTPLFHELSQEFLSYLLENSITINNMPFFTELAHYEWMQLMVQNLEGESSQLEVGTHDYQQDVLAVSQLAEIVAYHYPVHQIRVDNLPTTIQETFLCIYRDFSDQVQVMELNSLSARFLQILQAKPQRCDQVIAQLAEELKWQDSDLLQTVNAEIIERFLNTGIVIK